MKRLSENFFGVAFFLIAFGSFAQNTNQFDANKQRTGIWKKYYENQKIRYEGQFKKGKEIGVFKFYDESNSQQPTIIKKFSETTDSIAVEFYLTNGKLQSKGFFMDKNRVGKWYYFFPDGKIMSEEFYHHGKLEGKVINYYPNGKATEITHYKNGLKHGISQKYSSDGILIEEVTFEKNILNGPAKFFELNGSLREKGIYKNGKKYGKWDFYIDGEITSEDEKNKKSLFINKKQD